MADPNPRPSAETFASDTAALQAAALAQAEFLPLALAVVQATRDDGLLLRLQALRAAGRDQGMLMALREEVEAKAAQLLAAPVEPSVDAAGQHPASATDEAFFAALVQLLHERAGERHYGAMMWEQAGFAARSASRPMAARDSQADRDGLLPVAVIGAGMSGICAAIGLKKAGIGFEVFERGAAVSGTWAENTYPGCGVDTPSLFYAYSFEPSERWSQHFAKRDEIAAYFEHCVDKYGVRDRIRLRCEVLQCVYDEAGQRWRLTVRYADGQERQVHARAVITAVGQLNIPSIPRFSGADEFGGPIVHTAQWPRGLDLRGKRVGLIGTGASGMQVGPAVVDSVAHLTVFQREPHWVLPNAQYHEKIGAPQQWLMRHLPHYAQWLRAQLIWSYGDAVYTALKVDPTWVSDGGSINATSEKFRQFMLRHLNSELADRPDLRAKAEPDYPPYGKRVLLDNHWYRMLKRPHVELVVEAIETLVPGGVRTVDGQVHAADVLVLATGFQATRMLSSVDIRGRNGVALREAWEGDNPRAYLGITAPRFPNLFMLYGPNTNLGYGGSAIFNAECQVHYIVRCLQAMRERDWATMECRQDIHDQYNDTVDAMHAGMVWARQDVENWYRNSAGRVTTNTPWRLVDYWAMTREPDLAHFVVERPHALHGQPAEAA